MARREKAGKNGTGRQGTGIRLHTQHVGGQGGGLSFRPALATKQVTDKLVLHSKILSQRDKTGGARARGAAMLPERSRDP